MQGDFHYYATYCAAYLAGYTHKESLDICYGAQFVDLCSKTLLSTLNAPQQAATTMLQLEMMDARIDIVGLQDITRIWSSFHFLPKDLYAPSPGEKRYTKRYMNKYRLICGPDGDLVKKTVELAKGKSLPGIGIAMHVVADTWAHANFAGTPSLVINNTTDDFYELAEDNGNEIQRKITFRHNPSAADDLEKNIYTNSLFQRNENSVMNLGHGRAGHLPDYSFMRYMYLPAWYDYKVLVKDNPSDYMKAFRQLVYAMRYIRGDIGEFETNIYDTEMTDPYIDRIDGIIRKRQTIASDDWKAFGEDLSREEIPSFDIERYRDEYIQASYDEKDDTYIGKFIKGAIAHKGMVSHEIFKSKNMLAGFVEASRS